MNAKEILALLEKHKSILVTVTHASLPSMKSRISNTRSRLAKGIPFEDKLEYLETKHDDTTVTVRISLVSTSKPIDGIIAIKPAEEF